MLPSELDRSIATLGEGSIEAEPPGEGHAAVLVELECVSGGGRILWLSFAAAACFSCAALTVERSLIVPTRLQSASTRPRLSSVIAAYCSYNSSMRRQLEASSTVSSVGSDLSVSISTPTGSLS